MSNNIEVILSDEQFAKVKSLQRGEEVTYDAAISRAIDTQVWVEEKQAAGKVVSAATKGDTGGAFYWTDYEFLGENNPPVSAE